MQIDDEKLRKFLDARDRGAQLWAHPDTVEQLRAHDASLADEFQTSEFLEPGSMYAVMPTIKIQDNRGLPIGKVVWDAKEANRQSLMFRVRYG